MDVESGYVSDASSPEAPSSLTLTKPHLKHLNAMLARLPALDVLRFCRLMFPSLYQTTAFGLTGLVTLDMLAKLQAENPSLPAIDAIFLDTLYHFTETHSLIDAIKARYPGVTLHVYKPDGVSNTPEFEAKYGEKLWKTYPELYDWVAKVEPAERAYTDLAVGAVLTGRRRSQGAKRAALDIIEVTDTGLVKINPLASWSFADVHDYIKTNQVPYNELLDQGYKSIGDWHSTEPVKAGEDERAGRWKGQDKTECGIHNKKSRYAQFLADQERIQRSLAGAVEKMDSRESGRVQVVV